MLRLRDHVGQEAVDLQAGRVVLADDQERRNAQLLQARVEAVEARPLGQDLENGVGESPGMVGHETRADEPLGLRPLGHVTGKERVLHRHIGERLDAATVQGVPKHAEPRGPVAGPIGTGAGVGDDQRADHRRMGEGEVQGNVPAHGESPDDRAPDLQVCEERVQIGDQRRLGVRLGLGWRFRQAVAAHVVGEHAAVERQRANLGVPAADAAGEAVDEHEWGAAPGRFVVERDAIHPRARHGGPMIRAPSPFRHNLGDLSRDSRSSSRRAAPAHGRRRRTQGRSPVPRAAT